MTDKKPQSHYNAETLYNTLVSLAGDSNTVKIRNKDLADFMGWSAMKLKHTLKIMQDNHPIFKIPGGQGPGNATQYVFGVTSCYKQMTLIVDGVEYSAEFRNTVANDMLKTFKSAARVSLQ